MAYLRNLVSENPGNTKMFKEKIKYIILFNPEKIKESVENVESHMMKELGWFIFRELLNWTMNFYNSVTEDDKSRIEQESRPINFRITANLPSEIREITRACFNPNAFTPEDIQNALNDALAAAPSMQNQAIGKSNNQM